MPFYLFQKSGRLTGFSGCNDTPPSRFYPAFSGGFHTDRKHMRFLLHPGSRLSGDPLRHSGRIPPHPPDCHQKVYISPFSESGFRSGHTNNRGLSVSHRLHFPYADARGFRPYHTNIRCGFRCHARFLSVCLPVYGHTLPASPRSRPSRLRGFHASHTHKTPAFRWHLSGFPDCRPKNRCRKQASCRRLTFSAASRPGGTHTCSRSLPPPLSSHFLTRHIQNFL